MVKTGPFAMLWTLREEYVTRIPEGTIVKDERPPEEEMGDYEDDDDEAKLEEMNF